MAKKKDSLLKDAIADARTVRETALANAKAALEEAFMPHLTSMLSTKLKNEAESEAGEGEEERTGIERDREMQSEGEVRDPDVTDGHGPDEGGEVDKAAVTEDLDTSDIGAGDNKEPSSDAFDSSDIDNDQTLEKAMGEGVGSEVDDEPMGSDDASGLEEDLNDAEERKDDIDMDIEEIIKELEGDTFDNDSEDEFAEPDEDDLEAEGINASDDVDDAYGEDEGGQTDIADEPFASEKSMVQDAEDPEAEDEFSDEEDINLEDVIREIEADGAKDSSVEDGHEKVVSELKAVKGQLKEYRQAVKFLRSKLLEVNLLNAKLLFTNRLFKSYDMNVGQKMRVVETFDRATTLRETKLVYATLAESFKATEHKSSPTKKIVTEGLASKAVGSTKPKGLAARQVLEEGTEYSARFRKLAGIIKEVK